MINELNQLLKEKDGTSLYFTAQEKLSNIAAETLVAFLKLYNPETTNLVITAMEKFCSLEQFIFKTNESFLKDAGAINALGELARNVNTPEELRKRIQAFIQQLNTARECRKIGLGY